MEIDLNDLQWEQLDNFDVLSLEAAKYSRLQKILSCIDLEHLNCEEKLSIIDVIETYKNLFFFWIEIFLTVQMQQHTK